MSAFWVHNAHPQETGFYSLSDYRPIACAKVAYKIIARLLTIQMAELLPLLISPN